MFQNLQSIPDAPNTRRDRKDLNHLLRILCRKLKDKLPDKLLLREVPLQPKKEVIDGVGIDPDQVPEVKQEMGEAANASMQDIQYQRIPRKARRNDKLHLTCCDDVYITG